MSVFYQWWCNIKRILLSRTKVWNFGYASSQVEVRILLPCFPFNSIRASCQLLVSFLPPAWNPHIWHMGFQPPSPPEPVISVHFCQCLHFSWGHFAPWDPTSRRGLHLKLREALCWFPSHSADLPRPISQNLQKCPSLLILYVYRYFQKFSRTSYLKFQYTFIPHVLVRQKLKQKLHTLLDLNIYTTLLQT